MGAREETAGITEASVRFAKQVSHVATCDYIGLMHKTYIVTKLFSIRVVLDNIDVASLHDLVQRERQTSFTHFACNCWRGRLELRDTYF